MLSFRVPCSIWRMASLVACGGLIIASANVTATAQAPNPGGPRPGGQGQGGPGPDADTMFRNLDTNRDGKLTLEEAGQNSRNLMQHVFQLAGKSNGESVSREDFQRAFDRHRAQQGGGAGRPNPPPSGGRPGGPPPGGRPQGSRPELESEMSDEDSPAASDSDLPPLLAQLDGNSDGKLTRGELQRLTQMFDRLDADKDGALSVDEIRGAERLPKSDTKAKADSKSKTDSKSKSESGSSRSKTGSSSKSADASDEESDSRPANRTSSTAASRSGNRSQPSGVWRGWVVNGRGENPNSGQMEIELTIEGNQITGRELGTQRAPGGLGGGVFTMSGDGKSGNLDAVGNAGPQDGRNFQGIYEFDGETLRWCVSNRGRQRPTTMATDRGNYLMVLHQVR